MTQTELTPTASLSGKWKPYPDYKASGVVWLGEIPEHWEMKRSDGFLRDSREGIDPKAIEEITVFHYSIPLIEETGDGQIENGSNVDSNKLLIHGGELLVSKLNPRKSRILVTEQHTELTICSPEFVVLRPTICNIKFAFYLYSSEGVRQYLSAHVESATRSHQRVSVDAITKMWCCLPSLQEQRSIVAFLDREIARINVLIAKKERLIELLQEKRAALISHAVTKGLDPTVPMRDSGVEWLGEIQAHWEVAPLYSRYTVQLGKMLNQEAVKGFSPAPYLRNVNIQWDHVDLSDILEMDFNLHERQKYNLIFGDLLVCEGGEVGRTALWRGELTECYFQKAIHRVRPFSTQEDGRFLFYILYAAANLGVFKAEGNKSTIVHLTAEKLKKHRFAFPSLAEQRSIIYFLDRETAKIDALISRIQEGIEKLKEYSSALISAAVTGKIDVREEITLHDGGDL